MKNNSEMVLRILRDHGPMTSKSIADRTNLSKGAVSRAVGRLVENGSVQRGTGGVVIPKEK